MKIDLHTHVKISKKSEFSPDYFTTMLKEARDAGLNAIALTEHFNTQNFLDVYSYLDRHYAYIEDYYEVEGIKIFPGMEVDVKEVGHILIISNRQSIVQMFNKLQSHLEEENFISLAALIDLADSYHAVKIGGHPFRPSTPLTQHDPGQLKRLDALDLNGKDLYSIGIEENSESVYWLADKLDIPVVAGSDTHQFLQYGSVYNQLETDCSTITELKTAIQNRQYSVQISPDLHLRVRSATLAKKLLKQLLAKKEAIK
ncbi:MULTISPECIES: PHP domain-containing protein [Bacillaceae]|uniref:PHP domain-containing protein n=1 Tax=Bacillaceae TaxID=186817 RepID=UPI001E397845|nr:MULTISPECIES: PHP domain-containing protein [Bacillaceae]MCE4049219.1 PHP domain-containing protein [Bacillus sp. Au-Bac7]MCM3033139.1 PHP domain-containing protein [Niallia sp. MER 6]UPO90351.1 PHP domain-containing protein [Niallia sp. Man26]